MILESNISRILKSEKCYCVEPLSYYFHKKTKMPTDFYICVSVYLQS